MDAQVEEKVEQFVLTEDQQNAMNAFIQFLADPIETVFVLSGYSGCGKSTFVRVLLDRLPAVMKTVKLINPSYPDYELELSATTNKAAENLSNISGTQAKTIHSLLGLRVSTDYTTGMTTLRPSKAAKIENTIIFIDEASYIDRQLLDYIFKLTENCKIVFIGDPAQLTPVKSSGTPVFNAGFSGAALNEVVRQAAGNPIIDLSTKFRNTVNTGEFFSFTPDGQVIQYLQRSDFNEAIGKEFTRADWKYQDSKILAWTNKCVIGFNHYVRNLVKGDPDFQVGDYAVCNSFISVNRSNIKTDQLVLINDIGMDTVVHGVPGNYFTLDHAHYVFHPKSFQERNDRLKKAKSESDFGLVAEIESTWIDLRAAYACTINKSQGSTFDRVFIDLDDIRRCNSGDQIARMLYVAVSRARYQVFLTGDLA